MEFLTLNYILSLSLSPYSITSFSPTRWFQVLTMQATLMWLCGIDLQDLHSNAQARSWIKWWSELWIKSYIFVAHVVLYNNGRQLDLCKVGHVVGVWKFPPRLVMAWCMRSFQGIGWVPLAEILCRVVGKIWGQLYKMLVSS